MGRSGHRRGELWGLCGASCWPRWQLDCFRYLTSKTIALKFHPSPRRFGDCIIFYGIGGWRKQEHEEAETAKMHERRRPRFGNKLALARHYWYDLSTITCLRERELWRRGKRPFRYREMKKNLSTTFLRTFNMESNKTQYLWFTKVVNSAGHYLRHTPVAFAIFTTRSSYH